MKRKFIMKVSTITLAILSAGSSLSFGAALSLDGIDDWVSFVGTGVPSGNSAFTIGAWINPTSVPNATSGGQITFWGLQSSNQANGFRLNGDSGTRHFFWANDTDRTLGGSILSDTSGPNGDGWHHLSVTFDGSTVSQYWNGVLLGTASGALVGVNVADTNHRIGNRLNDEYFHGLIDEVSIWNVALDAATIGALYNQPIDAGNPAVSPFLVAYLNFENGLTDVAGGNNNGTFQGGATINPTANAPIPEPASALLGVFGLFLAFRRRR